MPLANRVTPAGDIAALAMRGLFMGNRGILHDGSKRLARPWAVDAWLICVTEWKGRKREIMAPSRYTELFFLDEVHALAAGHRPCHECRRMAARRFGASAGHGKVGTLDAALRQERLTGAGGTRRRDRSKRTHPRAPDEVPVGAMVRVGPTAFAKRENGFIAWSEGEPNGYLAGIDGRTKRDADTLWAALRSRAPLAMLTPPTSAGALARGYAPVWHPSAETAEGVG